MNQPIKPRQGGPLFWIVGAFFAVLAVYVAAWVIIAVGSRFWVAAVLAAVIVFCQFPHAYTWLVRKAVQGVK